MRLLWSIIALVALVNADTHPTYVPEFSIGYKLPLSEDRITIPNYDIFGDPPHIFSDRIILIQLGQTSGTLQQHAGIWSKHQNPYKEWRMTYSFRVSGGDRPGGSLNFWYTTGGPKHGHGVASVYGTAPWDGLVLVVDSHSGSGAVRGYLNDGSTEYPKHIDPTSRAFAHCEFDYRNKGHISNLQVTHSAYSFKVEVDGRLCFQTDKVRLPKGGYFGITATAIDNQIPDSFSLFNMFLSSSEHHPKDHNEPIMERTPEKQGYEEAFDNWKTERGEEDHEAGYYKTQEEQFADLHDRIQALNHHISSIQSELGFIYDMVDTLLQHQESFPTEIKRIYAEHSEQTDHRLKSIEDMVVQLKTVILSKDYTHHFENLRNTLSEHHSNMLYSVPAQVLASGSSKIGMMLLMVVMVQIGLAVAYMLYKRRRHSSPKKYL